LSLSATYREHDWDTTSNGLAAVESGRVADEKVLLAVALPAKHTAAEEQDLYRITCRQGCVDTALLNMDGRLRATRAGRDGTGLVGTVHCWYGVWFCEGSGRLYVVVDDLITDQCLQGCGWWKEGKLCERGVALKCFRKWDVLMVCCAQGLTTMTTRRSL
jgi:hypothetical protein